VFFSLTSGQKGHRLQDLLTADESAALLLAALGHDINHQGKIKPDYALRRVCQKCAYAEPLFHFLTALDPLGVDD